jgi:hypothetical protein
MKFKFEAKHIDGASISIEFEEDGVDEIISHFKDFLRGCSFADETVNKWLDPDFSETD